MLAGQAFEASRGLFGRASPQAVGKPRGEPASTLSRDRVQGIAITQMTLTVGNWGSRRVRPAWHRRPVGGHVSTPRGRTKITYQPTWGSPCIRMGLPDPLSPDTLGRTQLLPLPMSTFLDDNQCHAYDVENKCSGVTSFQQFLHGRDAILPHL